MKYNEYIKKVYNIAFRLTGEESSACELTSLAIDKVAKNIKNDTIDLDVYNSTAEEVCRIFLLNPHICRNSLKNYSSCIQSKLLALDPLSRTVVVWRDILGYKISDLAAISSHSQAELYKELNYARKLLVMSAETANAS